MLSVGRTLAYALGAVGAGSMIFGERGKKVWTPRPETPRPDWKVDPFEPVRSKPTCEKIEEWVMDKLPASERPIVILTGYNGRLGPHVVKRLEEEGYSVIGLGRGCKGTDIVSSTLALKKIDLTQQSEIKELLDFIEETYHTKEIASVIHLAGIYGFEKTPDPDVYQEVNVKTTENILHVLKKKGFRVGQFILGSSQAVYAPAPGKGVLTEEGALRKDYVYPASKVEAELITSRASFPTVVVRIPSVYEDHCNNEGLAKTITLVAEKSYLARFYPGSQHENGWSYMHMDDFTRAIVCIVKERERLAIENPHRVFHIGEEGCTTQPDLQNAIARALGRGGFSSFEIPLLMGVLGAEFLDIMSGDKAPVHAWMIRALGRVAIDTSAFRKEFPDFRREHSVLKSVRSMVESYRKDPVEFAKRHKMSDEEIQLIRLLAPLNYSRIAPERFALCSPE